MQSGFEQQVVSAAAEGAVVLTANKRLYRYLRTAFDRFMLAHQVQVWPSAQIYPYNAWMMQCLDDLGEGGRLLSLQQQRHLWENLITAATRDSALELMNIERTAEMAVRAHNLLSEHEVSLEKWSLTEDQQIFLGWRSRYLNLCKKQQWLDQGNISARILRAFVDNELILPDKILLVGFDQLPPGAAKLQALMRREGRHCSEPDVAMGAAGRVAYHAAADEGDETVKMARWVRYWLEQGAESIGIVVPDLQSRRLQIERILKQQIDPQAVVKFDETGLFGLSLGSPLANEGVVTAALACLEVKAGMTVEQVSFLLRNPFIAGSQVEADRRALFDRRLRSMQQENFSLNFLIRLTENYGKLPLFQRFLTSLGEVDRRLNTTENWADIFAAELKVCGWPGEVTLSSISYQAVKSWYDKVLSSFAAIDPGSTKMARSRAVRILRRVATETEFQPQSAAGPVQVVGLLESSGLCFDHLWVMGLEAGKIPALPRPNPFIPFRLQDDLHMPHASFRREFDFAKRVLLRLRHAAADIVFSYPLRSGDSDLSPSPLIEHKDDSATPPQADAIDLLTMMRHQDDWIEPWQDDKGPELTTGDVSGGTRLLQDQAHCPFRAFFHHRLAVQRFDQAVPGLSPLVRGDLVHLTLQEIWQQLKTQHQYLQLSGEEAEQLFRDQIEKVLAARLGGQRQQFQHLCQLEKQRLNRLVTEWFEQVERHRDPFVVEQTEQTHRVTVGPLQLSLKIDRVDRLSTGERVIIDYKTGIDVRPADFLTSPLIEPQLPCYAVAGGEDNGRIDGVIVAQIKAGNCRLNGIARHGDMFKKIRPVAALSQAESVGVVDWEALVDFWRRQLHQLAADFADGIATVMPFDRQKSCRYCDLPGLCRIGEIDREADDE